MKFFIDLIARSYLEYTQENDDNIAQFYFKEYYKVRPDAKATEVYSKKQFYNKLILKLDFLINKAFSKQIVPIGIDILINALYANQAEIDEATESLYDFKQEDINIDGNKKKELDEYYERPQVPNSELLWGNCNDAQTLIHGINNLGIILKDPISIIIPNIDIYPKPLVLRKSKLEYLRVEAKKAMIAINIDELDIRTVDLDIDNKGLNIISNMTLNYPNDSLIAPEKHTVVSIKNYFETIDKMGWEFAFTDENDFNDFVDLLALNVENKTVILPKKIIKLKEYTKTKVSYVLREIHRELSKVHPLIRDTNFFDLIRVLSEYQNMDDRSIYNSLTK